jgi:2-polyprenyl-3-methyl-5-hydroxy-6-metoxy-1,4-benzoquinol methylase
LIRRPFYQRDVAKAEIKRLGDEQRGLNAFVDSHPSVLQYRRAYHEAHGRVARAPALPSARDYPAAGKNVSYKDKLIGHLPLDIGRGAEIGPLNVPLLSKQEANVLYVDHLDGPGLKQKYPGLEGILDIDRPMINHSLYETLKSDAPLDYVVASQVFEHVPNPICWLQEIAEALSVGGLLALSLPDRRMTFDLFREESAPADMVAAYFAGAQVPDVRAVYDNQSLATAVNLHFLRPNSLYPKDVVEGRGANSPEKVAVDHLAITRLAHDGNYLDAHCWVFTPPSFLILMAQLAEDGFVPFRCHQFYPTDLASLDRGSSSFVVVLEKTDASIPTGDLRRSFLLPLG